MPSVDRDKGKHVQQFVDETSKNSTNSEQHVNSLFQTYIGSHIFLTGHSLFN